MVKRMSALGYHLLAWTKFIRTFKFEENSKKYWTLFPFFVFSISIQHVKLLQYDFSSYFSPKCLREHKKIWIFIWHSPISNMNRDRNVHCCGSFWKFSWIANEKKNCTETLTTDGKWNMHSNAELWMLKTTKKASFQCQNVPSSEIGEIKLRRTGKLFP